MYPTAYHAHEPPRNTDWSATVWPLATHNTPASVTFGYFRLRLKTPTGVEYNKPQPTRGGKDIIFLSPGGACVNLWSQMKISLHHRRPFMSRSIPYHCNTPITSNKVRTKVKIQIMHQQAEEPEGGKPVRNNGAWRAGRGPKAQICFMCVCISLCYQYLSTVQFNPFTPSESH